jgi:energy-coupling factor transporter ATP-binding protein EcfA2
MYSYKAFGLIIHTDIIFNELIPSQSDQPHLIIENGTIQINSGDFDEDLINNGNRKITRNKYYLNINGIAKYYAESGKKITIEAYDNALSQDINLYLLGSCIGAVLYQRKILPIHGSCININEKGVLLTGRSGAGKSTIASVLFNSGNTMLTDDVAVTKINKFDEIMVEPSYPSQKLWDDTIERSDRNYDQKCLIRSDNDHNKYSVPSYSYFCNQPISLKIIFEIIPIDSNEIKIEEITGADKIMVIVKSSYRRLMPLVMGLGNWHFEQCVNIAKKVRVFRIFRPENQMLEEKIAGVIQNISEAYYEKD